MCSANLPGVRKRVWQGTQTSAVAVDEEAMPSCAVAVDEEAMPSDEEAMPSDTTASFLFRSRRRGGAATTLSLAPTSAASARSSWSVGYPRAHTAVVGDAPVSATFCGGGVETFSL